MAMQAVFEFLGEHTPECWFEQALKHLPLLLIDHANCEKKAAATALNLMFRYVDRRDLLIKMAQLAREELLHFEQVVQWMQRLSVDYVHLSPSTYASQLHAAIDKQEPNRLVDTLIIGALIEARSCERFAGLSKLMRAKAVHVDLAGYYDFLVKSESRHFQDYLDLATQYSGVHIQGRIDYFRNLECKLITTPVRTDFRFHSGPLHERVDLTPEVEHQCQQQ